MRRRGSCRRWWARGSVRGLLREDLGPWRIVGAALIVAGVVSLALPALTLNPARSVARRPVSSASAARNSRMRGGFPNNRSTFSERSAAVLQLMSPAREQDDRCAG